MNRDEFIRQLELLLMNIPENERFDAINYYNDYFDDAGVENEQTVIKELGSPEKVAEKIKEDLGSFDYEEPKSYSKPQDYGAPTEDDCSKQYNESYSQTQTNSQNASGTYAYENYTNTQTTSAPTKNNTPWVIILIIAIFTFPLWIGIVAGLFGALVGVAGALIGVICALFGTSVGLTFGGFGCMIAGFVALAASPAEGLLVIGVGAILAAIGLLLSLLFTWLAFKWIPALCKAIYRAIKGLFHKEEGGNEI